MEAFIEFVKNWGYIAVFLGAMVEGESVILTASSMAYFGYLNIYKIMVVAFISTLLADQLLYYIGRHYGSAFFDKFPSFKPAATRAFSLLNNYDKWFVLSFRFIYGIRIISPIVIGASGIKPKRYTPLNIIAAMVWTIISCWGGYSLGEIMMNILNNIHIVQKYLICIVIVIGLIIAGIWYCKKK